ncbi:MAG: hypothetical protein AMJ43_07775 [Coxiella sp. DG_40]|nr:MAG: hypothetical protein AMJ43_07775 [Coxiella sp. DG_40]
MATSSSTSIWPGILSAIGTVASSVAASEADEGAEPSVSGFEALPEEVQEIYLQQILPQIASSYTMPYTTLPMQRVTEPTAGDPFASQALWDLQRYSDQLVAQGGSPLFSQYTNVPTAQTQTTQAAAPTTTSIFNKKQGW